MANSPIYMPLPWPLPRALRGSVCNNTDYPSNINRFFIDNPPWYPRPVKPLEYASLNDLLNDSRLLNACKRMGHDHYVATVPPLEGALSPVKGQFVALVDGGGNDYGRHLEIRGTTVTLVCAEGVLEGADYGVSLVQDLHGVIWRDCTFKFVFTHAPDTDKISLVKATLAAFLGCDESVFLNCTIIMETRLVKGIVEYETPQEEGGSGGGGGGGSGGGGGGGGGDGGGGITWPPVGGETGPTPTPIAYPAQPSEPIPRTPVSLPWDGLNVFGFLECQQLTVFNTICNLEADCTAYNIGNASAVAIAAYRCNSETPKQFDSTTEANPFPGGIMGGRVGWRDGKDKQRKGGLLAHCIAHAEIEGYAVSQDTTKKLVTIDLGALSIAEALRDCSAVTPVDSVSRLSATAIIPSAEALGHLPPHGVLSVTGLQVHGHAHAVAYGYHGVKADLKPLGNTVTALAEAVSPDFRTAEGGTHHAETCTDNIADGVGGSESLGHSVEG